MLVSTNRKAVLTTEDFESASTVKKRDSLILEHYDYVCAHPRDKAGKPYGNTNGALLNIQVVVDNFHNVQTFYQRLQQQQTLTFSLFFNPTFNSNEELDTYDQATKVDGYVVDILENYDSETMTENTHMTVNVSILISKIKYISGSNSVIQVISK